MKMKADDKNGETAIMRLAERFRSDGNRKTPKQEK